MFVIILDAFVYAGSVVQTDPYYFDTQVMVYFCWMDKIYYKGVAFSVSDTVCYASIRRGARHLHKKRADVVESVPAWAEQHGQRAVF